MFDCLPTTKSCVERTIAIDATPPYSNLTAILPGEGCGRLPSFVRFGDSALWVCSIR